MADEVKQSTGKGFPVSISFLKNLRPRIKRKTALKVSIMGLVIVIAIVLRTIRVRWGPYFDAFDPLFQFRVTDYIIKNGYSAWFTWHDTLSWWPEGRDIAHSSFPGVPFSAAFIYFTVRSLGFNITVHDVALYFPIIMAVLTCIAAYFLGKDLGGDSVGLFAAFFMATSKAFLSRTSMGFFDTENIGIFGMTTTALFFLRSIESEKPTWKRVVYSILSGLSMGYLFASWGASRYVVGLLTLFIVISLLTGIYDRNYIVSYGITVGVGLLIASAVPKLGLKFLNNIENAAVLFLILFLILYENIKNRIDVRKLTIVAGISLIFILIGVVALESSGVIAPLRGKFLRVVIPGGGKESPLYESVAEHHRTAWNKFFSNFGAILMFGILGIYIAFSELSGARLFVILFFLTGVYFAGSMDRLNLILSIPMSLMGAYGLNKLLIPFISITKKRGERRGGKRRGKRGVKMFWINRELSIIFVFFIFGATLPVFWGTVDAAYSPPTLASSSAPVLIKGGYPQDWLQALSWMRDNLPYDAIVVSWWDYGYWIEAMANKTTLADGATRSVKQIGTLGRIMMLNQSESLPLLEGYNATHIVVFNTFNPDNPQQQWPFGDNVKWQWMIQIGKLNLSDYYDGRQVTQKYFESNLFRLMTLQPDTAFIPVFISENRFVLVYEINYEVD